MKKKALLFLLLSIFALAEAKVCMAAVLFQDDFSGNLSSWNIAAGTWNIENGELHGIGAGGGIDGWIYAGDDSWTNYDFEARANLIEGGEVEFVFRSMGHWIDEYRLSLWSLNKGYGYENYTATS